MESTPEPTYRQRLAALNPRQRKFVQVYLRNMNATQAAIAAGYSAQTARQMGSENLSKPDIAVAVEAGLEQIMGKYEVRARTAEVAAGTLEDFLSIQEVAYTDGVVMDAEEAADLLTDTLATLGEELDSASEERANWIAAEIKRLQRLVRRCERAIARTDSEQGTPEVLVDVEWKTRTVVRLDLVRAREAGKLHLVKKLKETKFGIEIELHDAAAARELLGKHYRLWGDRLSLENPDGTPIKFLVGIPEDAL